LIFAARALGLYEGVEATLRAEQTTATIAVIQLGTLVAVLIYFAPDIWAITVAFVRDHTALLRGRASRTRTRRARPTAVSNNAARACRTTRGSAGWSSSARCPWPSSGCCSKNRSRGVFTKNLWVIATMMIAVALLLALAERVGKRRREMKELGWATRWRWAARRCWR
jgi:undecaprenyl-diphosphatase